MSAAGERQWASSKRDRERLALVGVQIIQSMQR
jgi:hypothetical protein